MEYVYAYARKSRSLVIFLIALKELDCRFSHSTVFCAK